MITVRETGRRGHANYGWLDTHYTFSFAEFHDPKFMGFRSLRVMNEDRVQPGQGFGTHPHRNMEIVTYVLEGALEHRDSMGNHGTIRGGEVQRMSAGTGVLHSEFNPSKTDPVHLLQIWIMPEVNGIAPSYEQARIEPEQLHGALRLVAGKDPRVGDMKIGAMKIHQDAELYAARLAERQRVEHAMSVDRYAWIQVVRGKIEVNGIELSAGDGAAIQRERTLAIAGRDRSGSEFLLFDLS